MCTNKDQEMHEIIEIGIFLKKLRTASLSLISPYRHVLHLIEYKITVWGDIPVFRSL
jgi:hypothetical protein